MDDRRRAMLRLQCSVRARRAPHVQRANSAHPAGDAIDGARCDDRTRSGGSLACRRAAGLRAAHPHRDLPDRDHKARRGASRDRALALRRPARRCFARWTFATSKRACPASWGSAPRPGTGCSGRRGRRSCTRSARSAPERATRSPPRATCCSTSAPSAWICASSWRRRSWRGSASAVSPVDEVHGFRYFDDRDLLGFVDGTENPRGERGDRRRAHRRRGPRLRRRQLRHRAEIPARPRRMERAADRGAGAHHRPHQALRHRAGRRRQADLGAQRADRRSRRTARRSRSCATTCRSAASARASSAPTSSATPARPAPSSRCSRTCSSAGRPATTTGCSTSAAPSPAPCSSCRPRLPRERCGRRAAAPCRAAMPRRAGGGRTVTIPGVGARWFARHRLAQRRYRSMNNLHRELAPISDAAWAQIEEEASRTLKRYLAGRRVVDVHGPGGIALPAVGTGHLRSIEAPADGIVGAAARGEGAGRAARSVRARSPGDRRRGARRQRLGLAAGEGRRAPDRLRRRPRHLRGLRRRRHRGHPPGHQQSDHDAPGRRARLPRRHRPGVEPVAARRRQRPLCGAVSAPTPIPRWRRPATTAIRCWSTSSGWSTTRSSGRRPSPAAFVLTTRGGDFDLHIGQDVSIGYLSHTDTAVRLYLQETLHLPAAHQRGRGRAGAAGEGQGGVNSRRRGSSTSGPEQVLTARGRLARA